MLLMMAEVLHLPQIAKAIPDSPVWAWLAAQQSHVAWVGCSLHDLIQPSFSFLVGAALPYSLSAAGGRAAGAEPVRPCVMAVFPARHAGDFPAVHQPHDDQLHL